MSCSASTIDTIDSRRPSDTVRVPETLEEADSISFVDQWRDGVGLPHNPLPWDGSHTRGHWHRDRWLSDERNSKLYTDKSADIDSGTETHHVSESDGEDCNSGLQHQSSITSSCSASAKRRYSYSVVRPKTNILSSYDYDSECECGCANQYHSFGNIYKPDSNVREKHENNNVAHELHSITLEKGPKILKRYDKSKVHEDPMERIPLTITNNT